jgi:hypothetical protein
MAQINEGRYTAEMDKPLVIFMIGMRVNRFWAFSKWLPVARVFPKMLTELYAHPEKGFLHGELFFRFGPLTTAMISYWRSFKDLEAYAHNPNDTHLPAWREFNKNVGNNGMVGIWHETYEVEPGHYEVMYGNMPLFGLGGAMKRAVPVVGHTSAAKDRLKGTTAAS